MTLPFSVRDISYSTDAIRARIDDLTTAIEYGMNAVVSTGAWALDGPARIVAAERLRGLLAEIDSIRSALLAVYNTVYPLERDRTRFLNAASLFAGQLVMSGPAGVAYAAWSGHLWSFVRPVAHGIIDVIPRGAPTRDGVVVSALAAELTNPPQSLRDRVSRIPSGDVHIRIERYHEDGGNRFEVYLSGTNFAGNAADPWNVAANVDLATTGSSPSLAAVRTAMESAGITRSTPVVITGHSQGGLIALAVAAKREFDVEAIITVGTPVGVVPDVSDIPIVHIIHPEDPVPAAGGLIDPRSSTWVIPVDGDKRLFEAHHKDAYTQSAATLDDATEDRLDALRQAIQASGVGVGRNYLAVATNGESRGMDAK